MGRIDLIIENCGTAKRVSDGVIVGECPYLGRCGHCALTGETLYDEEEPQHCPVYAKRLA